MGTNQRKRGYRLENVGLFAGYGIENACVQIRT